MGKRERRLCEAEELQGQAGAAPQQLIKAALENSGVRSACTSHVASLNPRTCNYTVEAVMVLPLVSSCPAQVNSRNVRLVADVILT